MAGEVQGYRGGDLVVLDGAAQGGGTFHQLQLNARIREQDLFVLARLGRHLPEHPALVGGEPWNEVRHSSRRSICRSAVSSWISFESRPCASQPQLHEAAGDEVGVGLETLLDGGLEQAAGLSPPASSSASAGRLPFPPRPGFVKGGAPQRRQGHAGLFHGAPQLVAGVAHVAAARGETPDQLAQARQGSGRGRRWPPAARSGRGVSP